MATPLPDHPSLVADIGGTNTRVALADGPRLIEGTVERFRNADHKGLEPILAAYLEARGVTRCKGACIAVAGPVQDGRAELTNIDWTMDTHSIGRATGAPHVALLNDLQAQGHAIGRIPAHNLVPVIEANAGPRDAPALVIGAGTGFNAAPVYHTPTGRFVPPSEAGHVALPARGPKMRAFVQHLEDKLGFASVEEALAGAALKTSTPILPPRPAAMRSSTPPASSRAGARAPTRSPSRPWKCTFKSLAWLPEISPCKPCPSAASS